MVGIVRILMVILAFVLVFSMSGCGGESSTTTTTESTGLGGR